MKTEVFSVNCLSRKPPVHRSILGLIASDGRLKSKSINIIINQEQSLTHITAKLVVKYHTPGWIYSNLNALYNGGNVGIGTLIPVQKLEVNGNIKINQASQGLIFSSGNEKIIGSTDNSILFQTQNATQMSILNNGNVGIGITPISEAKLDVNGNIYARSKVGIGTTNFCGTGRLLYVAGGILATKVEIQEVKNWADFVFAKDYKLQSLKEVEQFISENKHLLDVPSESQVKKDGIDVVKMNATLLQKVEELTLYLIEQNKRIEKLESENAKFKATCKK